MKAIIPLTHVTVEVEGETQKDLFQEYSRACEVFGEKQCGLCGCKDIHPVVRTVTQGKKVYEYPEWHCENLKCRARLTVSQNMEGGTLFPCRKLVEEGPEKGKPSNADGKFGPHNGWTKYKGNPTTKED